MLLLRRAHGAAANLTSVSRQVTAETTATWRQVKVNGRPAIESRHAGVSRGGLEASARMVPATIGREGPRRPPPVKISSPTPSGVGAASSRFRRGPLAVASSLELACRSFWTLLAEPLAWSGNGCGPSVYKRAWAHFPLLQVARWR
jgi:hypothetical protein